jgi:hypothetical protein
MWCPQERAPLLLARINQPARPLKERLRRNCAESRGALGIEASEEFEGDQVAQRGEVLLPYIRHPGPLEQPRPGPARQRVGPNGISSLYCWWPPQELRLAVAVE